MDRIDLVVEVARPDPRALLSADRGTASTALRELVGTAREFARHRQGPDTARMSGAGLLSACGLNNHTTQFLERAARTQHLSGRGITRLLRVARTLADLEQRLSVSIDDLSEALGYRTSPLT